MPMDTKADDEEGGGEVGINAGGVDCGQKV